jgi:hypothetical protein
MAVPNCITSRKEVGSCSKCQSAFIQICHHDNADDDDDDDDDAGVDEVVDASPADEAPPKMLSNDEEERVCRLSCKASGEKSPVGDASGVSNHTAKGKGRRA